MANVATHQISLASETNHPVPSNKEQGEGQFVGAFLLLLMITISMNLAHFLKHKKFTYLGETALYIIFGITVSALWTSIQYDPSNSAIQLDSHFFSLVLLPPIIFEGGYSIQRSMFFSNIIPILGLALFGGIYSTFIVSALMWIFSRLLTSEGWTLIESLVFGSLISSTDPVTVLSLLPADVDKRLYIFIFGESALNDAVAIILYRFFVSLQEDADNLTLFPFFLSIIASGLVFLGSFIVGTGFGLIYAKITRHVWITGYEGAMYEMIMLISCAYSSYLFAEIVRLTGIISIFFCGITIAHYATPNMTELTKKTVKVTLRVTCMLFEGFIFLYFGLGLLSFGVVYDILLVLFAVIAILIGRTHVFIVCGLTEFIPGYTAVPWNQQVLIWFSGLRGAVAFALAVSFLDEDHFSPEIKKIIFATTVLVILFTVLGLGTLTPYMLEWLHIVSPDNIASFSPLVEPHEIKEPQPDPDQTVTVHDLEQPVFGWLYRFDIKYVRPYFTIHTEETTKVLEVIKKADRRRESIGEAGGRNSVGFLRSSVIQDDVELMPLDPAKPGDKEAASGKKEKGENVIVEIGDGMDTVALN